MIILPIRNLGVIFFIRGKNNLTPLQTQQRLRNTAFMLLISPEKFLKQLMAPWVNLI